ncbi:MAG: type II toxin-antitoxin system RelE/ParE family toxin [Smithella sp.]
MEYTKAMIEIRQTEYFIKWFEKLKDRKARARIAIRIRRVSLGNLGDAKPVGDGISELRIDYGPGYRVYFTQRNDQLIILIAGGDKTTQVSDIQKAKKLALEIEV